MDIWRNCRSLHTNIHFERLPYCNEICFYIGNLHSEVQIQLFQQGSSTWCPSFCLVGSFHKERLLSGSWYTQIWPRMSDTWEAMLNHNMNLDDWGSLPLLPISYGISFSPQTHTPPPLCVALLQFSHLDPHDLLWVSYWKCDNPMVFSSLSVHKFFPLLICPMSISFINFRDNELCFQVKLPYMAVNSLITLGGTIKITNL